MTRNAESTGPTAPAAAPLRLAAWPAARIATLAGEGVAADYTVAPAPAPVPADLAPDTPADLGHAVGTHGLDAWLGGLDGDALFAVADRVVSRLAVEALTADDAALADSVATLQRLGRRVSAEWHRRIAELDERDAWQVLRCRSTADWLTSTLALTTYEARAAVEVARVLHELPQTAARFAAGEIDAATVQTAAKAHAELARLAARAAAERDVDDAGGRTGAQEGETDDGASDHGAPDHGAPDHGETDHGAPDHGAPDHGAPDHGAPDHGAPDGAHADRDGRHGDASGCDHRNDADAVDEVGDEDARLDDARDELDRLIADRMGGLNRAQARARVAGWQHTIDARYGVEREQRAWRRRGGRLHVDEREGSGHARFDLDPVGIATVKAALEPLARKSRSDDDRSYRQRLADAFVAVCQRALDEPEWLPESAGGRPQVLAITIHDTLDGQDVSDPAYLDGVGPISSATAQLLACDGTVTEVVVDAAGRPLQVRETGRATTAQRQAVIARDQGCVGCGAPVSRTEIHHIVFRRNHGATAVTNLVLLCWGCHRKVHHHGWRVLVDGGSYRLVPPWDAAAARGIGQPAHCGRQPR